MAKWEYRVIEFEDEEAPNEEIIDEEELMMLKDMKELKREYRDNFNKLKAYKQELRSLQENIDVSKEQLIFQFENWYNEEFEHGTDQPPVKELNMAQIEHERVKLISGSGDSHSSKGWVMKKEEIEDEDAAVYRRAK